MLIEDEDNSSHLQHFDYHSPGPAYLLRHLGIGGEYGRRKGICAKGCDEAAEKRKKSEVEPPICNNDREVVNHGREGNEEKFKSILPQGGERKNHVDISGRSGSSDGCGRRSGSRSDRRRGDTLEVNQLDLIFHESVKAVYEGTNAQVEIPTITRGKRKGGAPCPLREKDSATEKHSDDVDPDKIHIKEMTNQVNFPQKIENVKIFLKERLENVNQRNKQLFVQSMSNISETLNYNFLCICQNGGELDPASFAWHDSFLGHAVGGAATVGRAATLGGTPNVAERDGNEGERDQWKELPSSPSSCPPNIYKKLKNIRCVEEPGHTYKYVYPPKYKPDLTKEVTVPKGSILFNSKFESANLKYVLKQKNREVYSIFLNHDVRSNEKKNQWFYFSASYVPGVYYQSDYFEERKRKNEPSCINRIINEIGGDVHLNNNEGVKASFDSSDFFLVSNVKKLQRPFSVQFKIENMSRPYFLYKEGHSPLVFSQCRSMKENVHWERAAYNVTYTRNDNPRHFNLKTNAFEKLFYCTYTLEFSYDFVYPYDTVYFASSLPYSYSYLLRYLGLLKTYVHSVQEREKKINYVQGTLCTTACGFPCTVVAITNYDRGGEAKTEAKREAKTEVNTEAAPTGKNYVGSTNIEGSHRKKIPGEADQAKQLHSVGSIRVPIGGNPTLLDVAKETPCQSCEGHTYIDDARCMYNLCHPRWTGDGKEGDDNLRERSPRKCSDAFMRQFERLLERHSMHPVNHDGGKSQRWSATSPSLSGSSTHVVNSPPVNASPQRMGKQPPEREAPSQPRREGKKIIFLTARVHPGETNASYVMHGFLAFITSENAYADSLRDNFIFIVIPMLNIDGVILGHNRLCSNGFDLNRQWNRPIYYLHQTVHTAKTLIRRIHRNGRIVFFCDFHGHSRKYNCFLFGNSDSRAHLRGRKKLAEIFPEVLGASLPWFSLEDTKFKSDITNRGVARHVCGSEFAIDCSYTFEVSLIGVKMRRSSNGVLPEWGRTNEEEDHSHQAGEPIDTVDAVEAIEAEGGHTCDDKDKYNFFFYDENVLMLTGISFGISLFKFFNFVSHHKASISEGGKLFQEDEEQQQKGTKQMEQNKMVNQNGSSDMPPSRFKANRRMQIRGQLACHRSNMNMSERKKKGEIVKKANLRGVLPLGRVAVEPTLEVKNDPVQPTACVKGHPAGGGPLEGGCRSSKASEVKGDEETSSSSRKGKSTSRYAGSCGSGSGNCNGRGGEGEWQLQKGVAKSDASAGKDQRAVKEKGLSNRRKDGKVKTTNDVKESHVQEEPKGKPNNRGPIRKVPTCSMKKKHWMKLLPNRNPFFCLLKGKGSAGSNGRQRSSLVKVCLPGNGNSASKEERHGKLSTPANRISRPRIRNPCVEEDVEVELCEELQPGGKKKPHGYNPKFGGKKRSGGGHPTGKFSRQKKRPLPITRRKLVMIKKVKSVKGRKENSPQAKEKEKGEKNLDFCFNHGGVKGEYLICLKRKRLKGGLGLIKLLRRKVRPSGVARASDSVVGEAPPFRGRRPTNGETKRKRKRRRKKKNVPGKGVSMSTLANEKRDG
ncbi:hypothetical protein C922_04261 [Plasmodium inui San Antonio 1]|uniref:Peptidase M14 domain-containing protein n=1 Tax=Plasmodium inui San Antonio 1 TaxID=1237626 RepID=W7A1S0_9APIC|nr:hypothetical protein C922_04261 [Plasmodium inui San Antonio 1]EUD65318.1 hypothetical protein C922_04261 [Plasmodium inui San Antonio 1]